MSSIRNTALAAAFFVPCSGATEMLDVPVPDDCTGCVHYIDYNTTSPDPNVTLLILAHPDAQDGECDEQDESCVPKETPKCKSYADVTVTISPNPTNGNYTRVRWSTTLHCRDNHPASPHGRSRTYLVGNESCDHKDSEILWIETSSSAKCIASQTGTQYEFKVGCTKCEFQ